MSERAAEAPAAEGPKGPCDRREEILAAATCLFAEHGYAATDTQRLADKLGVGKGTLYRNFPSKRELFLAAVDRSMRQLHDRIQARIDGMEDPFERVSGAVEAYLDFFDGHPEHVELLIQERAQFKDRSRPTYFIHREKSMARWRSMYRSLIEEGRVRPMPVERITDVISAALYGSMFLNYFAGRTETFAATADDILDVVFFGILSDGERRRRLEGRDEHGNEHEGP